MVTLPLPAGRIRLLVFWLVLMVPGAATSFALAWTRESSWFAASGTVLLGLMTVGICHRNVVSIPYKAWNRLARAFSLGAEFYVTLVCYLLFFPLIGVFGSRFDRNTHALEEPRWHPLCGDDPDTHAASMASRRTSPIWGQWLHLAGFWFRRRGNWWVLLLSPFFVVLAALEVGDAGDKRGSLSPTNYTLY